MYLFIYKTTHVNGRYYIGRHQTERLEDGYLGSGDWVKSIKDKSTLGREIIDYSDNIDDLKKLEEYYIKKHWDDPLCMNRKKGSDGWTSEDIKIRVKNGNFHALKRQDGSSMASDRVKDGTHHFLTRPDGTNINTNRVKDGTHPWQTRPDGTSSTSDKVKNGTHPFMTRPDGTNLQTDRVNTGTHPFMTRPDGTNLQTDKVKEGTHHFLTRSDGTNIQTDKVKSGTHHLLTRPDGTNIQTDRINAGTHNFLKNKGLVSCYDKNGKFFRISKEQYYSQTGPKENWEWVGISSKEGKERRKSK